MKLSLPIDVEESIAAYLAGSLPDSEERIPEPMAPGCEVCVVIPAYGEREYILMPLESLALQKNVKPDRYEVIVVVNNPAEPPGEENDQTGAGADSSPAFRKRVDFYRRAVMDNRETLKLLRFIKEETMDDDLGLSSREEEAIERIRRSGLKLHVLDKAGPGKTLPGPEANVGGARNRGAAEAVERFYKQVGKNGIIAQVDADTRVDENYIYQLIKAFAEKPHWVALSGRVEEIVSHPEDSAKMREFNNSIMRHFYYRLVTNIFTNRLAPEEVIFFGCNTASRAFSLAAAGGVPKIPGGEDIRLGKKLAQIGEVGFAPGVIVSAAVRYSARAATGRGHDMIDYSETLKQKGTIEVQGFDAVLFVQGLMATLQDAVRKRFVSLEYLRAVMMVNNEPLFTDAELVALSQRVRRLNPASAAYEHESRPVIDQISAAVAKKIKPVCIKNAAASLIQIYCMVDKVKKEFHSLKARMIQEIKEYSGILEYVLDEIFGADQRELDLDSRRLSDRIVALLEKNNTPLITPFLEAGDFMRRLSGLIAAARTKHDAMEMLKANYMAYLVLPPGGSLEYTYLELRVLHNAVINTKLDRPVYSLLLNKKRSGV